MNDTDTFITRSTDLKDIQGFTDVTFPLLTENNDNNLYSDNSFLNSTAKNVTHELVPEEHFIVLHPYFVYGVIVISLFGIPGNILTVFALVKEKLKSFSILLCCLFISDSCLIVTFVALGTLDIIGMQDKGRYVLICIQPFIGTSSGYAAMIGIERSVAVIKPIWYRQNWRKRYTVTTVVSIAILNLSFELGREMYYLVSGETSSTYFRIADLAIRRYIPFICIATGNVVMSIGLYRSQKVRKEMSATAHREVKATKTALVLVLIYFLCMTPGSISLILIDLEVYIIDQSQISAMVSIGLELFNASVNFVVYALSNRAYQMTFVQVICCCCKKNHPQTINEGKTDGENRNIKMKY